MYALVVKTYAVDRFAAMGDNGSKRAGFTLLALNASLGMICHTILKFKRRAWLLDTKSAPARVQLFGDSGLFTQVEPMDTSTTKIVFRPNFKQKKPAGFKR